VNRENSLPLRQYLVGHAAGGPHPEPLPIATISLIAAAGIVFLFLFPKSLFPIP